MAATGDDAAAMDSISRAPAAHSATPNPTAGVSSHTESPEDAAENLAVCPKKSSTNSETFFYLASVVANANNSQQYFSFKRGLLCMSSLPLYFTLFSNSR